MPDAKLPAGFVYPTELCGNIILEIRYFTSYNFVGEPLTGYEAPRAVLTEPAARALCAAAERFEDLGYAVKIYDAYRPRSAVEHFLRWGGDLSDQRMKDVFYPEISKEEIFTRNFISPLSAHSRGSALDITLVDRLTGKDADMGGVFDLFGEISSFAAPGLSAEQRRNRQLLRSVMEESGFEGDADEWWHFRYKDEPYPDRYFDFPIV